MKDQSIELSNTFNVSLAVIIMEAEGTFVAYCPALDLSTYGDSEQDVKAAFDDAVKVFFEETTANNTLEKYLVTLGWTLTRYAYVPPVIESVSDKLNEFPEYEIRSRLSEPVSIPYQYA